MNLCIFTCRIITYPRLSRHNKKALTQMLICLPNNKKTSFSYNIKAKATGKIGHEVFNCYRRGDFVIIEGLIKVRTQKKEYRKKVQVKKDLFIKIHRIHPVSIVF